MALDGILPAETVDRASGQDQTAHICNLILIYIPRKISPWSQTAG